MWVYIRRFACPCRCCNLSRPDGGSMVTSGNKYKLAKGFSDTNRRKMNDFWYVITLLGYKSKIQAVK